MRRPGATDRRGTRIAGYDPSGALQALIASLGGWWWDGRTGIVIAGSGVSSWTDRVQGGVLSQGTAGKQPAYSNGLITCDGVDDFLVGTPAGTAGADAITGITVCSCATAGNAVAEIGTVGAGRVVLASVVGTGRPESAAANNVTFNIWDASAGTFAMAVYAWQAKFSDGISAAKPVYQNGTAMTGSTTTASDVSGTTTGTSQAVGARSDGVAPTNSAFRSHIMVKSLLTSTQIGSITSLCRAIYGV